MRYYCDEIQVSILGAEEKRQKAKQLAQRQYRQLMCLRHLQQHCEDLKTRAREAKLAPSCSCHLTPRTSQDIVTLVDFAPTFLDIAGVQAPEEMDGISMLPALHNDGSLVRRTHGRVFSHFSDDPTRNQEESKRGIRGTDEHIFFFRFTPREIRRRAREVLMKASPFSRFSPQKDQREEKTVARQRES